MVEEMILKVDILSKKLEERALWTIRAIRYSMLEEYRSKGEEEIRNVRKTQQSLLKELNVLTEEELTNILILFDREFNVEKRMDAIEFIKNRDSPSLCSLAVEVADTNLPSYLLKTSRPLWDCYERYYTWRYNCSIWKEKRDKIIKKRRKCERCGSTKDLHVHHIKGLSSENSEDLELLCRKCHKKILF